MAESIGEPQLTGEVQGREANASASSPSLSLPDVGLVRRFNGESREILSAVLADVPKAGVASGGRSDGDNVIPLNLPSNDECENQNMAMRSVHCRIEHVLTHCGSDPPANEYIV
jgi:hypothetical protein